MNYIHRFRDVFIIILFLLGVPTSQHRFMIHPPPMGGELNKYTTRNYDLDVPMTQWPGDFPCKGALEKGVGQPVLSYKPGKTYQMKMQAQGANHDGGSCQISLSFDKGGSWKVIKSILGNCPRNPAIDFDATSFTIPHDTPEGEAYFAWTWFNNEGNREMYMNCAHITVANTATKRSYHPEF
ncbi:hypothetical protein BJ508DRAFT_221526, partial [Ascobolus immersus RN42]